MASRKEEKERLRAQRLAAERAASSGGRRRLFAGYVVAGALALAVVAGLVAVIASGGSGGGAAANACSNAHIQNTGSFKGLTPDCRTGTPEAVNPTQYADLSAAAQNAGCQLKLNLPDEGNTHVPDSTPVHYGTVPPTSGNHNPVPISDGAYTTPVTSDTSKHPNIRNEVHAMEHGRIEIHYKPGLPQNVQLALKGVFDADPPGMLLYPDPNMPYDVAVTAWTNEVVCPKYNPTVLDVIRDFRDQYRGNGPEQQIPINLG
ncbi:MAG: hypothetical protein QOD14_2440 [Solirubrobacterales bacterium]|jgi:hypothetical protein|nr:hypothetical protein [Solirubrobacterales bacterium]